VLEGLEQEAREGGKGLWADPQQVPPWEWRRRKSVVKSVVKYVGKWGEPTEEGQESGCSCGCSRQSYSVTIGIVWD
jgi:hypothetical protein